MKEYKVISWSPGFTKNNEKLEDVLNQHAKVGWTLKHIGETSPRIILEREKNR
jgi:hypothetical protein